MHSTLKQWIISATAAEINNLAAAAGTSVAYLHQIASGHRRASACTAGAITDAANEIRRGDERLPVLRRSDLCEACGQCPHARLHINN